MSEMTVVDKRIADYVPSFAIQLSEAAERLAQFKEFISGQMKEHEDYGVIPGTQKPTLLKPGAEKLCNIFGFAAHFQEVRVVEDWDKGFFYFSYRCDLINKRTSLVESECIASTNSLEEKYRWRYKKRECPTCSEPTIIKGKEEYGGGWLCWKKDGGCGAKFQDGDEQIEGQQVGKIENPDPYTLVNTLQKMAQKRALIGAVLIATRASGIFTQDIEEMGRQHVQSDGVSKPKPRSQGTDANNGRLSNDSMTRLWHYARSKEIDKGKVDLTLEKVQGDAEKALILLKEERAEA